MKTQVGGRANLSPEPHRIQPILPVGLDIRDDLTADQLKALKLIELQFARDVSTSAATAYQAIMTLLGP